MKRIGVIGYGSIGKRHIQNLKALRPHSELGLLRKSGRGNDFQIPEFYDEESFFSQSWDAVMLCNRSADHFRYLERWLPPVPYLFLEKPMVISTKQLAKILPLYSSRASSVMVGFNMRFHPLTRRALGMLKEGRLGQLLSARFFVGQYLPDWRPGRDYREIYSAKKAEGGGVVFDLIHEIDLAYYFAGAPLSKVQSIATNVSALEMDAPDLAEICYLSESKVAVSIHLDCIRRGFERHFELIGSLGTLKVDFVENSLSVFGADGAKVARDELKDFERNSMYKDEMESFLNSVENGLPCSPHFHEALPSQRVALEVMNE